MDDAKKQVGENDLTPEEETSLTPDDSSVSEHETSDLDQKEDSRESESYGVEAPSERVYPSGISKSSEIPSSNDGEVSVEAIYSRRKEKDSLGGETAETEPVEPVPLPNRPFLTRLLRPLINPGMFIKLGCLAALLWGLFLITVPLFQRSSRRTFKEGGQPGVSFFADMKQGDRVVRKEVTADQLTDKLSGAERVILGRQGEVVFGAWRSYAYFFLFAFVPWIFCAIPFLLQITEQTSDGDDKISDWPELSPIPMCCRFGWFCLLVLTAGIPGYFIFGLVGLGHFGFILTLFVLFPVFYLSTADTDSFFCLLSKNILRGVKIAPRAWRNWYFLSFVLAIVTLLIFFVLVGEGIFHLHGVLYMVILVAVCAVVVTFSVFLYFRLLGRLAWIVRDRLRKEEERSTEGV